jgi:hypothetical protein
MKDENFTHPNTPRTRVEDSWWGILLTEKDKTYIKPIDFLGWV